MIDRTRREATGQVGAAAFYANEALRQVPRLLSTLDRQPESATFGSFDRDHWSWKFRDFPLGMLQVATYPLALLWAEALPGNVYHRSARLLGWIDAAIGRTLARQRPNGSFDAFAPNEQDIGPTLGVTHGLIETFRIVRDALSRERQDRVVGAVRRAADFALPLDETHAFISNHQALFALAFLGSHELTGDDRYRRRADAIVRRIIDRQSAEGWYCEYGGADPGYESLGILHLAAFWRRTGAPGLLESLRRSVAFYAHFIHPDGGVGGAYGSRHTSLYFPAGFEILAPAVPLAAAIAAFMRERQPRGNVLNLDTTDVENLPVLMYAYLEAARCATGTPSGSRLPLPCEALEDVRAFEEARLVVAGTSFYYAVVNAGRGGLCRIFDRRTARIAYEDAGYVVTGRRARWASQLAPSARAVFDTDRRLVECSTRFGEVRQAVLTTGSFLLLRLLNLTLFRSRRIANLLRRRIVDRLITGRRPGPLHLARTIAFEPDAIRFDDRLTAERPLAIERVALPRAFTALHMGSASYYHASDLQVTAAVSVDEMAADLGRQRRASKTFLLRFGTAVTIEVVETAGSDG